MNNALNHGSLKLKKFYIYLSCVILLLSFQSCASFRNGLYTSFIDKNGGSYFLANENNVREYLENVMLSHENFFIKAYTRNIFTFQFKKTKLLFHSFFVISDNAGEYHTISFYGSDVDVYSRGVWVMDTSADTAAYNAFISKKNNWDVSEIVKANGINTERTVRNIITMIDNNVCYYYKNHIKSKPDMHNCNTALDETLVGNEEETDASSDLTPILDN